MGGGSDGSSEYGDGESGAIGGGDGDDEGARERWAASQSKQNGPVRPSAQ